MGHRSDLLGTVASYEYAYDDLNRLVSLSGNPSGVVTYLYDANGNLKETKTAGLTFNQYEYDARDQLRRVSNGNNQDIARYDYDLQQRRLAKFLPGGVEQRYVYGPDTVINEFNWQDQLTARYDVAAERVRGEFAGEGARFYFSDALGSVTALAGVHTVNNQAQPFVAACYEYDAWGNYFATSGVTANAWGYKAERADPETGLQAWGNGQQYYSAGDARFIQDTNLGGMLARPGGEGDEYRRLRRQSHASSWFESLRGYAGRASYIAGDAISFGGRAAQDRADTDYADSYISGGQYAERTAVNTIFNLGAVGVSAVAAAYTGGLSLAAQLGSAAGLGVAGKFLRESYEMRYEGRVEYGSLGSYLATAALSAGAVALKHGASWALGRAAGPGAGVPGGGEPGAIGPGSGPAGQLGPGGGLAPRGPSGLGPYMGGGGLGGSPIPANLIAQGVGTGLSQALVSSAPQTPPQFSPTSNLASGATTVVGQQRLAKIKVSNVTDELDLFYTRSMGKIIADNPVAYRSYQQIQRSGRDVKLDFSTVSSDLGLTPLNKWGEVEIFMRGHSSFKEAVSTIVHEASHVRRIVRGKLEANLYEEYRAFRREALFMNGFRPSLAERRLIWENVKELYPHLEEGYNPFRR